VGGRENRMLFSGTTDHSLYDPGTSIPKSPDFGIGEGADGRKIFENVCATCHQATGLGIPSAVPPLRSSDFLVQDRNRAIRIVMSGLRGPVTVNGFTYDSIMPDPRLNDEQIAGVLTYEFTHLGNNGQPVTADEVAKVRKGWDGTSPLILAASAKPNPRRP
jgi:mono/diheme cytochrome c family protein